MVVEELIALVVLVGPRGTSAALSGSRAATALKTFQRRPAIVARPFVWWRAPGLACLCLADVAPARPDAAVVAFSIKRAPILRAATACRLTIID